MNGSGVFLDRDGVLIEQVEYLSRPEQVRLLPGAAAAVRRLSEAGLPTILITNQRAVALGLCSEETLLEIHDRLASLLAAEGARLDAIFYCPHHESAPLARYRRRCPDRKPGTGMVRKGLQRYGLDPARCFLVGDSTVDMLTAANAGATGILVLTGYAGRDGKHAASPAFVAPSLAEAVEIILSSTVRSGEAERVAAESLPFRTGLAKNHTLAGEDTARNRQVLVNEQVIVII